MDLAQRFRELRQEAGLTASALARPRYSVSYVSQIEAGRRRPAAEAAEFFAERLGVSVDYLLTGVPEGVEVSLRYDLEAARRRVGEQPGASEAMTRAVIARADEHNLGSVRAVARKVLGEALLAQGRIPEAIDALETTLSDESLSDREAGFAVAALARAYLAAGDLTYAAEVAEDHLAKDRRLPIDRGVAVDLNSVLVSIYFERGDVTRAERAARRALAASDEDVPPEIRAIAYWNASRILAERKEWDEALELATRARVLAEELGDQRRVARLHNAYAFICLEADPPRAEEARQHLDRAERLLGGVAQSGADLAYVHTERSRLALMEGNPEDGLAEADRALAEAGGQELERARALFLRGRSLAAMTRRREAREALHEAAELFDKHGARQQQAACWRELGEMDFADGDLTSAVASLRAGLEALDPRRSRA